MDDCITCDNLCDAQMQTMNVAILSRDLATTDTEIYLVANTIVPAVGYGLFNGCVEHQVYGQVQTGVCNCRATRTYVTSVEVEDKYEIIKYCGTRIEDSGEVVLTNLIRGLPFSGCDDTISVAEFIKEHSAGEYIKIGTPEIHYYWCKMCNCISDLRSRIEELEESLPIR